MSNEVFNRLKEMLFDVSEGLVVVTDKPDHYYLDTRHIMKNKKPLFFAAVKTNKRYVSFHLMPVYVFPELLSPISSDLRKRMQGKSCFNFTQLDEELFRQLNTLLEQGLKAYKTAGYIAVE